MLFRHFRGQNVLTRGRPLGLTQPFLYLLLLFFGLSDSPRNTLLYLEAALMNRGPGGLLHLIHGPNSGAAVAGLLSDGTAAPFLLDQCFFILAAMTRWAFCCTSLPSLRLP